MGTRRIPVEDFFRKPERIMLRLSPDGQRLAWLAPWERRLNLHVRDLQTGAETRVTQARERDLAGYLWANDQRLIYLQDTGGDENYRLYAVDHDGGNPVDLTPFEDVVCSIVDDLEDVDGEILFSMNKRDKEVFDVYRLNVDTGEMEVIAQNPGNVSEWITDHDGKLRVAVTTDGVNSSLLYRETESDPWATIATYTFKEQASPLFFTADNRGLFVSSNVGRDKRALFEYDLTSGSETELLFEHPSVDVGQLLWSRHRKRVTGVAFETDRPGYAFFDDHRREIQEFLDRELPGAHNGLTSHDREEKRFIVHSASDRTNGSYYDLDAESMTLQKIFDLTPWLDPEEMAEILTVHYEARDGLRIQGYLTLPVGREPRRLPMVVHPHGGPWHRDSWGFNPIAQLLANRGYAVLQMNFRGSTGYGRAFWEASFGEWGLSMQDDVTDGVRWAIEQGVADPDRVAIFGGSYGGYATLCGLTKTPELYACGVSYVGVSNLFTWLEAIPPYWKPYLEMVHEMVGHPERDQERLRNASPLFQVDRIRAPLFVAQGANDPRVKKEESDQVVAALRERGLAVEYMVKENEGHGFHNEENNFEFYSALCDFLRKHIGGPAPLATRARRPR